MSEARKNLFQVVKVKAFGLREKDYFNEEHLYYYQNLFFRGEVSENFPFIKICNESDKLYRGLHLRFFAHILSLFEEISLPNFDQYSGDDLQEYVLHGAEVLALTYCGNIIAIGNNKFWIPVSNFFEMISEENIKEFKKKYLAKELNKAIDERAANMKKYDQITSYMDDIVYTFMGLSENHKPLEFFNYLINFEESKS